jgi:hypothetical protein
MTLLLWGFVAVEGKTRKSGEKSGRVVSDRGSLRRAQRSAQPHFNQQRHLTQNKEAINDKRRHKNLTESVKSTWVPRSPILPHAPYSGRSLVYATTLHGIHHLLVVLLVVLVLNLELARPGFGDLLRSDRVAALATGM